MNKKIINIDDDGYIVLGTVSAESGYSTDELKSMWVLADTVLRNGNEFYVCMRILEGEFIDI